MKFQIKTLKNTKFKILCIYAQCEQIHTLKFGSVDEIPQHFFGIYQNRCQITNKDIDKYKI